MFVDFYNYKCIINENILTGIQQVVFYLSIKHHLWVCLVCTQNFYENNSSQEKIANDKVKP